MLILVVIFFLFGSIQQLAAIQCYKCIEDGNNCALPLNFDTGDESNENTIVATNYDATYSCMSDQSWDPYLDKNKIILRGTRECVEINVDNHRVYCCDTDNCNRYVPEMKLKTLVDIGSVESSETSNTQRHLASTVSIAMALALPYFL